MTPDLDGTGSIPDGACDTHMHIFSKEYPKAPTAVFEPPDAPLPAYLNMKRRLGLSRTVVVQPTHYGSDNACTLAAIASLGATARGVAIVDVNVTDAELERLTQGGIRGLKVQMFPGGVISWDELQGLAARAAAHDWFVQIQFDGRQFPDREEAFRRLPARLLIDHTGKFLEPVSADDKAFQIFLRLIDSGRVWFKIAAPYETSKSGAPGYEDVGLLAQRLIAHAPERGMWGTNWPHVNYNDPVDEGILLDRIKEWTSDEKTLHQILVDTPAEFFGF